MSSFQRLTRPLFVAATAIVALTGPDRADAQVCADFDPPGAGAWGCCGAVFMSDGIEFQTGPFTWVNGVATAGGNASIVNACNNLGGHSLWLNNVTVQPKIEHFYGTSGVRRLTFFYNDFGGNVNLQVNGILAHTWNEFFNIPGGLFNPAGVQLITPPPVWTGSSWRGIVILDALPGHCIEEVLIGGQELCIDDVCAEAPCFPCPEDVNGDGFVDFGDVLALFAVWGPCPGCPEDFDGDGVVGFAELLAIIAAWGPC